MVMRKLHFASGESLYGTSNSGDFPFATAEGNLNQLGTDGLYGAGRFAYSTNQFSSSLDLAARASASNVDINFDSD